MIGIKKKRTAAARSTAASPMAKDDMDTAADRFEPLEAVGAPCADR